MRPMKVIRFSCQRTDQEQTTSPSAKDADHRPEIFEV